MWDIKDKVVLITGATNGIGKATAFGLAKMGARVVIHGRSLEKAASTVKEIIDQTGNKNVDWILADLTSLADVKRMAKDFIAKYDSLHVLINNAGSVFIDEGKSKEGYEITFAVNCLSHFLLTELLLDLLKKSAPSRIIHLSSEAHRYINKIDFKRITEPGFYKGFGAYCASKLSFTLFAYELAEILKGSRVTSNAVHPGVVRTGFGLNTKNKVFKAIMRLFQLFIITPEKGAETSIYLASSADVEGVSGKYFDKSKAVPSSPASHNMEYRKEIWNLSKNLLQKYLS